MDFYKKIIFNENFYYEKNNSDEFYSIDNLFDRCIRQLGIGINYIKRDKIGGYFKDDLLGDYIENIFSLFLLKKEKILKFYDNENDLLVFYVVGQNYVVKKIPLCIFILKEVDIEYIKIDYIDMSCQNLKNLNGFSITDSKNIRFIDLVHYLSGIPKYFNQRVVNFFISENLKDFYSLRKEYETFLLSKKKN